MYRPTMLSMMILAGSLMLVTVAFAAPAPAPGAPVAAPKVHHALRHARIPLPTPRAAGLDAYAATPAPAVPPGKLTAAQVTSNPATAIQQFTTADLQAALDDANAQVPPDTVAISCYTALLPIVQSGLSNPLPKGAGFFQAAQKARDAKSFIANLQSPTGPLSALNQACAAWVLDGENMVLQIGAKVGLVVGTGGLGGALPALGGLGGGLLPFKLP